MVCAINNMTMNNQPQQQQHQQQHHNLKEEEDDFDTAMEEDDFSEEDSSQDDDSSTPSANSTPKRPANQALFLNFTSDLSPQKTSKKKPKTKKQTAYRVNGVNILNRNNLDSKTAIERIQRRRENHNHVERRRRDNINNTIFELSSVVPNAIQPGQKPNKGSILKLSLDYIKDLQAENQALKERLSQYSSSRPSSISPPLSAATLTNNQPILTAAVMKSVDESFSNNNFQSPSAPNSPSRYRNNNMYNAQSVSVPSSPHHTFHSTMQKDLPPPLTLPPPRQQQQPPQQHLQTVFSSMSVSSNSSSTTSTPILSATSYPVYINNNNHQQVYIPQPPLQHQQAPTPPLYNEFNNQKQGFRPLLPATKSQPPPTNTSFLPSLRMSGYEKIYGNVCRY